jgi:hypothetical protein
MFHLNGGLWTSESTSWIAPDIENKKGAEPLLTFRSHAQNVEESFRGAAGSSLHGMGLFALVVLMERRKVHSQA